jgi:hypothetical protein
MQAVTQPRIAPGRFGAGRHAALIATSLRVPDRFDRRRRYDLRTAIVDRPGDRR